MSRPRYKEKAPRQRGFFVVGPRPECITIVPISFQFVLELGNAAPQRDQRAIRSLEAHDANRE